MKESTFSKGNVKTASQPQKGAGSIVYHNVNRIYTENDSEIPHVMSYIRKSEGGWGRRINLVIHLTQRILITLLFYNIPICPILGFHILLRVDHAVNCCLQQSDDS